MERIGGEVERTLAKSGGGSRALAIGAITSIWPRAVGPAVARNAWPLRLSRDDTLHVATTSATWAFELDRLSAEILEKLAGLLEKDTPSAIRFRPGPVPEPGAERVSAPSKAPRDPPADVVADAASAASAIEDPELRELVARAARASLSKARSDRRI